MRRTAEKHKPGSSVAGIRVLANCIADREETYHHWQVFSRGSDGMYIQFCRKKLLAAFDAAGGITHHYVKYHLVTNANAMRDIDLERLPFMKRWPYGDEKEYRAVYFSAGCELQAFPVPIPLAAIDRITLNPWLAPALADTVKHTLKSLPGWGALKVYKSTDRQQAVAEADRQGATSAIRSAQLTLPSGHLGAGPRIPV